jgi:hypothetical protein
VKTYRAGNLRSHQKAALALTILADLAPLEGARRVGRRVFLRRARLACPWLESFFVAQIFYLACANFSFSVQQKAGKQRRPRPVLLPLHVQVVPMFPFFTRRNVFGFFSNFNTLQTWT